MKTIVNRKWQTKADEISISGNLTQHPLPVVSTQLQQIVVGPTSIESCLQAISLPRTHRIVNFHRFLWTSFTLDRYLVYIFINSKVIL